MKKLKGLIAMFAMACLFTPGLMFAQGNGQGNRGGNMDPQAMAKRQTDMMKTQLKLTDEQVPKVENINLEASKKMADARTKSQGDRDAMRTAMKGIRDDRQAKLKEVLTPDQYTKWEQYQKERMDNRGGRRGQGGGQGS